MQWTLVRLRKCILQLPLMTQGAELQRGISINDVSVSGLIEGRSSFSHNRVKSKFFLVNKMFKRPKKVVILVYGCPMRKNAAAVL